jgi:ABC-type protease/lipase transport system fused ATPase/permease subunit
LRKTGIGLVIVSHRPETVGAVDRIVRLGETVAGSTQLAA